MAPQLPPHIYAMGLVSGKLHRMGESWRSNYLDTTLRKGFGIASSLLSLFPPWTYIVDSNPHWQEIGAFLAGGISAFIVPLLLLILFFITGSIGKHVSLKIESGSKYDNYLYQSGYNCLGLFVGLIISPTIAGMIYDIFRDYKFSNNFFLSLYEILIAVCVWYLIFYSWTLPKIIGKYFSLGIIVLVIFVLLGIRVLDGSTTKNGLYNLLLWIIIFHVSQIFGQKLKKVMEDAKAE